MAVGLRHGLILGLTCLLVFFLNLGAARLFDEDEPKNAECGREMFERGDWLVPTYNYELRTDKPIMLYWLMLSSYHAFGVSEFAARFPSALMASLTIGCIYLIGRRLFDAQVGFWGALILASTLMYAMIGRISTPDATLIGFITLSLLLFVHLVPRTSRGWGGQDQPTATPSEERTARKGSACWALPRYWPGFVGMYAVMGLAVLTKGPVGFLLPCGVIGLFLMCVRNPPATPTGLSWREPLRSANELTEYLAAFWAPSRFFSALGMMRPGLLCLVVLTVALPWYLAVGLATEGAWLQGFLGDHNVGRFSSAMEGHHGPFFYYVIAILIGFFPWSVFLPIALHLVVQRRSDFPADRRGLLFLLCWAGLYVGFFSLARTKLPNYVLPAYPPLALLLSWVLVRFREARLEIPGWALRWGAVSLVLAGIGMGIAFPVVSWLLLPNYTHLAWLGVLPVLAGVGLLVGRIHEQRARLLQIMGPCCVLTILSGLALAAPWISQAQESFQLGQKTRQVSEPTVPLATYRYFTTNLPFYAERPITRYHSVEEIRAYLDRHPHGLLCLRAADWSALLEELPDYAPHDFVVIGQSPRFLRGDDVLLLRHAGEADGELRSATRPDTGARLRR